MILAGIDIGTNTLRLLIADIDIRTFQKLYSDRKITRLGQDLDRTGRLTREAEERSIAALADFSREIRRWSAVQTVAVGTSALRNASNSAEFISRVKRETGIVISVIPGEDEARLTLKGVEFALSGHSLYSALVFDIGGGSTEIIIHQPGYKPMIESLPLGAVYLTERLIKRDPPTVQEIAKLRAVVKSGLRRALTSLSGTGYDRTLVGTGGTVTTLAAIDQRLATYDPEKINGAVLNRESLSAIVSELSQKTRRECRNIPGLEPGREDIILAGAIIVEELLAISGCSTLTVSDWGLREGIILDLYQKLNRV